MTSLGAASRIYDKDAITSATSTPITSQNATYHPRLIRRATKASG